MTNNNVTTMQKPAWMQAVKSPQAVKLPKSILLYGFPGTYKTTIAGGISQVAGIGRTLFIDVDHGAEVLSLRPEYQNIDVLPVSSLEASAMAKLESVVMDVAANGYGFDAVVFDTIDVGQDAAERSIKKKYEGTKNTFGVYGDLGDWTDRMVRALHESPHFVAIFTAHAKEQTNESGAHRILPRLSGSSKEAIGGIPSVVAYLEHVTDPDGNRRMVATVGESERTITKNRYNLPNAIVDFTLPKLYAQIEANTKTPAIKQAA